MTIANSLQVTLTDACCMDNDKTTLILLSPLSLRIHAGFCSCIFLSFDIYAGPRPCICICISSEVTVNIKIVSFGLEGC